MQARSAQASDAELQKWLSLGGTVEDAPAKGKSKSSSKVYLAPSGARTIVVTCGNVTPSISLGAPSALQTAVRVLFKSSGLLCASQVKS
jgi:hypothetical protein